MYKNDRLLKEYTREDSPYKNLLHGPLIIDDYIGDALDAEDFCKQQKAYLKLPPKRYKALGVEHIF